MTVTRLQFVVDCSFHAQVLLFLIFYSKVKRGHFIYPKRPFWLVCYAWLKRIWNESVGQSAVNQTGNTVSSYRKWQIVQPNKDQKREGDLFKYSLLDKSFHITCSADKVIKYSSLFSMNEYLDLFSSLTTVEALEPFSLECRKLFAFTLVLHFYAQWLA